MRREVQDNQTLDKVENDNDLLKVGVDVNTRSEFNVGVGIKVKVEWRSRWELSWSSWYQNQYLN